MIITILLFIGSPSSTMTSQQTQHRESRCSLRNLVLYFLKLGSIGFGGPIALVGYMEKDLVEERAWLTREEYLRGLALSQLAPGPLAAQLAMYIGYIRFGFVGATCVGCMFVLPSFVMVVLLGILYAAYGGLEWMRAMFYGVGAAVIGIIVKSAYRLAKVTLKNKRLLWMIFVVMGVVTAYTQQESIWLFFLCGLVAMVFMAPPKFLLRGARLVVPPGFILLVQLPNLTQSPGVLDIFLFFAKASVFVFGSGLAIVPFLYGSTVQQYHWLTEQQFIDAVAVAMITPGPVVITVGFIGYIVGALPGAMAAALGVFLPVYLVVVLLTPFYEHFAHNSHVDAFVQGVTAAASGAIAGAVVILGRRAITDFTTAMLAISALAVLVRFKTPEPIIVLVAAIAGLLLFH